MFNPEGIHQFDPAFKAELPPESPAMQELRQWAEERGTRPSIKQEGEEYVCNLPGAEVEEQSNLWVAIEGRGATEAEAVDNYLAQMRGKAARVHEGEASMVSVDLGNPQERERKSAVIHEAVQEMIGKLNQLLIKRPKK